MRNRCLKIDFKMMLSDGYKHRRISRDTSSRSACSEDDVRGCNWWGGDVGLSWLAAFYEVLKLLYGIRVSILDGE